MKKNDIRNFWGILLTGILLLGGCSSDSAKDTIQAPADGDALPSAGTQASTQIPTVEAPTEEEERATEETMPPDVPEDEDMGRAIPQIVMEDSFQDWYSDDGTLLLDATFSSVSVQNSGFDNLSAALDDLSDSIRADISGDNEDSLLETAKSSYSTGNKEYDFINYSCDQSFSLGRVDADVVSLRMYSYIYSGGAHGNYGATGYTFDVESGNLLALEDILADKEGFYSEATGYIVDVLYEEHGKELFSDYAKSVEENWTNGHGPEYYLDASGIVIPFNPYSVGPYVMGDTQVTLSYKRFGKYMDPRYLPPHGMLAAPVAKNEDISSALGLNGPVMIEVVEDDYEFNGITVISGTASDESIEAERFVAAYVLRTEPDDCLLAVSADYASDDLVTCLYRIGNDQITMIGEPMDGLLITGRQIGPDGIEMEKHLDVLGTYSSNMLYTIGADGTLTPTEDVYRIDTDFEMTVTRELPVTIDGAQTTLPVGSTLKITGTDDNGTAHFRTGEGREGTIAYTSNEGEWGLYIDSVSENEYFEMIPYAG